MTILSEVDLPNFYRKDPFAHKAFAQTSDRTISGAMIIETQALKFGEPINLTGGWMTGAELTPLLALESSPTTKRKLTLTDGAIHWVVFDIAAGGVAVSPLFDIADPDDSTQYNVTIHLLTVEPDAPAPTQE